VSRRIRHAFSRAAKQKRAAFIPYITVGDPTPDHTVRLVQALERAGSDIIELGVPFTDPIADGPVIQRAAERALAGGTTLTGVLQTVREIRYASEIPIVVFTYFNPVHAYGLSRFAVDCAAAGVDGVLLTAVPVEELGSAAESLGRAEVDVVPLIAPTSTRQRIRAARKVAGEFVYFIARTGVTGRKTTLTAELAEQVKAVRKATSRKVAVGFGVSTAEQVHRVAGFADGVVVGSALVARIEELGTSPALVREVEEYAGSLAKATRRV